jgi:hypothetical protein
MFAILCVLCLPQFSLNFGGGAGEYLYFFLAGINHRTFAFKKNAVRYAKPAGGKVA